MAVSYQKFWNILTARGMTRSELREATGITTKSITKLERNESVEVDILAKICCALNCTIDEILEIQYEATFIPSKVEQRPAKEILIEELEFSIRAYNCLKRAGLNTVDDIAQMSSENLMRIRNMSRKPLEEIQSKLAVLGITLKENKTEFLSHSEETNQPNRTDQFIQELGSYRHMGDKEMLEANRLENLELSFSPFSFLMREHIIEISSLISYSEADLMKKRGCTPVIIDEIKQKLALRNLSLRE